MSGDELNLSIDSLIGDDDITIIGESIQDAIFDYEAVDGSDEIDTAFEHIADDSGYVPTPSDGVRGSAQLARVNAIEYPAEPPMSIDPTITTGDMMILIYREITRKKIAGHHIDSMNSFNSVGIKYIATKVFAVEGRLKNERDVSDEDKKISEILFRVDFTDINLHPPVNTRYLSGAPQMMTPAIARLQNLTYSTHAYIDAKVTATAVYKDGSSKVRTATVTNHRIGSIPCAIGTDLCHTSTMSKETLKHFEEDPLNPGGYFIIKGLEWTVDNLENITNNTFHVYKNMYQNEIVRGYFLSKPGDAFENSYQVILRYLNNGAITIELTPNKFDKIEIPYYLVFRALGMSRDIDIVNNIVYGVYNEDPVTKTMLEILERAFEVEDPKFREIRRSTNSAEIIAFIARIISESANTALARKDDNVAKYLNNNVLNIIDRFMFPHIGNTIDVRIKKLRFLGHLINKLLLVYMDILEPTDRDSYKNKRVFSAGTSMAKTFKTDFNFAVVQTIKKHLMRAFKSTPFSHVQLAEEIISAIKPDDLERMLTQAITNGNKTITVKRNEVTNRISSQTLYHKNDMNVKSTLNTINTPNVSVSKQNERADEMRRVHPTYLGYIDVSQSADTSEKVGTTKQMACTASISGASSSAKLKQKLLENPDIIHLDDILPEQITAEKLAKVFVNGDWIGCHRKAYALARDYRIMRRHNGINRHTSIVCEVLIREVYFWTDVGRMLRPLVIVYNNIDEYKENYRNGDRTATFTQWIKLTKSHIRKLQSGAITINDLVEERVIEYISPEEQENALIADNIDKLREHVNDLRRMYTHCDIDQALFGIVTLAAPCANHSNAVRNTMYTNHRKQSAGWFALNYPYRIDKNTTLQHYCERPIVSTFSDSLTYPNGHNTIVALMLHGGRNMEDSVTANQSSIDCGSFNASHYNNEKVELEKGEQFGNPDYARTMDIKKEAIYEYVHNGLIAEGTIARKNYVLIVKTAKIPKPVDNFLYIDKSIVYKKEEPVYIERSFTTRDSEDALIAKVKYRADRSMAVGDKFCLSPDHDVLTRRGWTPIGSVSIDDEVATLHDGNISYEHPTEVMSFDHAGDMYEVETADVSQKTTLNHRMYVRIDRQWDLVQARDLLARPVEYKKWANNTAPGITYIYVSECTVYMDDWLELLGTMIIGGIVSARWPDGCSSANVPSFAELLETTRMENCAWALQLCAQMNIDAVIVDRQYYIYTPGVREVLNDIRAGNHRLPDYAFRLSAQQSRILFDQMMMGHDTIYTPSGELADDLCRLALHCGISVNIKEFYHCDRIIYHVSRAIDEPLVNAQLRDDKVVQYVGPVHCITVPSHVFYVRRNGRGSWTGNSSRTGNKGICSNKLPRHDMPYCEDGLVPDLIVNAHSIPTRMAVNQIIECVLGQLAAVRGAFIDATCFRKIDIDGALKELENHGIKYGGHRRMYNGMTGEWIDTLIFIGPTTYQRLQKFVIDEHYAMRTGPTSAMTRQPLDGKLNDGGLRLGEMEKDVFCAHGTMRALFNKFYDDSDGIELPICRMCGNRAIVNEKVGIYKCKYCGDNAHIVNVASSWVANLFFQEASAMNNKMTFGLEPFTYSKMQE